MATKRQAILHSARMNMVDGLHMRGYRNHHKDGHIRKRPNEIDSALAENRRWLFLSRQELSEGIRTK